MTITSKSTRAGLSGSRIAGRAAIGLLGLSLLPACSDEYLSDGVVTITTGQETDAWTVEPAAKSVRLELVQGTRTTLAEVAAPATQISIGTDGPEKVYASVEATAFDVDDNPVMRGSTVPVYIRSFNGARVPLFMGRVGGWSRAPGELYFARRHPKLAVQFRAYLLVSGGDEAAADLDLYDLASWRPASERNPLPKVPESWAVAGSQLLLVDQAGAVFLDASTAATSDPKAPAGLHFVDVVGGETIGAPGEPQYIVGATRTTGEPTNVVVRLDPDATLHLLKLATPRLGAAAAMVNGQLLVVGGADTGAGAEVSNAAGTGFTALPFPTDATQGSALVAEDATTALLVGGRDPATDEILGFRTMHLDCTQDCDQTPLAKPEFAFDRARLFSIREGQVLAVGEDPVSGETHVFTFDTGIGHALTEFPLRVPRSAASAFLLPNGQVGVLGGDALADGTPAQSVELFFPEP
jgi:hypothetical protein